ncbi:hypothetical protein ACFYO0_38725 [Streptomyces sp. NPDC006365]|uniref:hypothetical protein n=1 Tax=Streptomyces sp. NPDC006365 TaxID=3364744 RepID=UPI00367A5E52
MTAMALAALALSIAVSVLIAGIATYSGREQRGSARLPQYVSKDSSAAKLWVVPTFDTIDGVQHSVVRLEPLTDDAPLPPGVTTWPRPGKAVLSPKLRALLAAEGDVDRYGDVVGAIGAEGLEVPGERLAYVRSTPQAAEHLHRLPAAGFGGGQRAPFGDMLFSVPEEVFLRICALLLLPALALTVLAVRVGSAGRDRRIALLRALGAGSRARAMVTLGEAAGPVCLGASAAALLVIGGTKTDVTIPFVDFTLSAADLRRWFPELLAGILAAVVTILVAAVLLHRVQGGDQQSRLAKLLRAHWLAGVCPLFLVAAVMGPDFLFPLDTPGNGTGWVAVYLTGVLGTLATLPALVSAMVAALTRLLRRAGNRRGNPGMLVAGGWLTPRTGAVTRMVAGVVVTVGLLGQIQLQTTQQSELVQAATHLQRQFGGRVLTLSLPPGDTDTLNALLEDLPEEVHALALTESRKDGRVKLWGTCEALTALDAPCRASEGDRSDARIDGIARWTGGGAASRSVTLRPVSTLASAKPSTLVLVNSGKSPLPIGEIKHVAYRNLAYGQVGAPGSEWDISEVIAQRGRWIQLLGGVGVLFLALAAVVTNLSDFVRLGRTLAPLAVLTGQRRLFWTTSMFVLLGPLLLAAVVAVVAMVWLGAPMMTAFASTLPASFVISMLAGAAMLALVCWLWGARTVISAARRWHPTAE